MPSTLTQTAAARTSLVFPAALCAAFLVFAPGLAADDAAALIDRLDAIRGAYGVSAFGAALVSGQETVFAGARGITDLESGRAADDDTVFRIGSITKAFTALAVLMAADDGLLDLGAPLDALIGPGFYVNPWAPDHPVTLVHLLEHSAGFADLSMEEMYHSDPAPLALEDAVRFRPQNRRVLWRPGLHYSYTNAGAGLAGYALKHRTGIPYEVFVRERIFAPLAMDTAALILDSTTRNSLAAGYKSDTRTPIPYWHMLFRAFGAINARPRDMAGFIKLFTGRGEVGGRRIVPGTLIARMEFPESTLAARSGLRFGYGLGIYSWFSNGMLFHGHGGDGDGYLAHFGYSPRTARGYFVVINAFTHVPLRKMRKAIEQYLTRDVPTAEFEPVADIKASVITGTYERATYRFPQDPDDEPGHMEITVTRGQILTRKSGGEPQPLLAVNAQHFRRTDEPSATIAIVIDERGRLFYQGEHENYQRIGTQGLE
ncbi:MAG: serine hydrolase domain-containing protein [Gammaproteobacteria bacterium]